MFIIRVHFIFFNLQRESVANSPTVHEHIRQQQKTCKVCMYYLTCTVHMTYRAVVRMLLHRSYIFTHHPQAHRYLLKNEHDKFLGV